MTEDQRDGLEEQAALFALGLLSPAEQQAFQEHLLRDQDARDRVSEYDDLLSLLSLAVAPMCPPPGLRAKLLDRLRDQSDRAGGAAIELSPGLSLVVADGLDWQPTAVSGVRVKPLHVDSRRRYARSLVAMDRGSCYPPHRHFEVEELFMLSGRLRVAGHLLSSGDYCRAEAGTVHGEVLAETDCLFIALASLDNEFIPARVQLPRSADRAGCRTAGGPSEQP